MAQILDKQGLQHYANKMCNADNRKVGSKNLPTALNEIDIAIDGFKTLFETEYGTPVNMELENNENVFSIGTGTNIDKRSEIENSFTDVELSGNSLVNLCVTDVGRLHFVADGTPNIKHYKTTAIKPNTKYTIITNVLKNTINNNLGIVGWNITDDYQQVIIPREYVGLFKGCFTTNDKIKEVWELDFWRENTIGEIEIENIIILEGDWTNKPVPQYFEGLKSIGEKEDGNHKISISSVGKNLFNINENPSKEINPNHNIKINDFNGYDIIAKNDNSGWIYSTLKHKIILKPNKDYRISCDIYKSNQNSKACIRLYSSSLLMSLGTLYSSGYVTFRTPSVVDDFYLLLYSSIDDIPCKSGDVFSYRNIQIEVVSDSNNDYSPFRIDKKEILLNEPLRGLPNGIRDTIEKVNGEWKIVRRCGEVILNGSEPWALLSETDKEKTIGFRILNFLPLSRYGDKYKMVVCDRFPSYKHNLWKKDYEGITTENNINDVINDTQLQIIISKSKLSTKDIAGFKQWLSQNPTKVIYQLDTPIIEDISPITLQCWKNGTISIDEAIPVETTHTVALNKSAQIQKNIEELTLLRNRVEALEKQYNNSTLNQAYELELLRLDMQLDNII